MSRVTAWSGKQDPSGSAAVSRSIAAAMRSGVPGANVDIQSPSKDFVGLTRTRPTVVSTMLTPTSVLTRCPSRCWPAMIST